MACGRNAFFLFAVLASLAIVLAEEGSGAGGPPRRDDHGPPQRDENGPPQRDEHGPPHDGQPGDDSHDRFSFSIPFFSGSMGTGNGELPSLSQLFGGSNGSSSNPFGAFMNAFSQFLPGSGNNSRLEEVHHEDAEHDHQDPQDRLFFGSLFGVPTACNYTTQAGRTCAGCRERLTCYPSNAGRLRVCSSFLAPYCNNGRCSRFPGSACFSTSSSSSSATTSGTTTT